MSAIYAQNFQLVHVIAVLRIQEIYEEYGPVDEMSFTLHNIPLHLKGWPHWMEDRPEGSSSWNFRLSVNFFLSSPQSTT